MQKVEAQTELALLHTSQRQDEFMSVAFSKSPVLSEEDVKVDVDEEVKISSVATEVLATEMSA